mmetsp:Transcript_1872/g.5924  ORF Transcript_1872/g.5924 Transcript_1872/m.5924 type:complete len:334 (+) Transcript_1872:664-1665(+)
MLYSAVSSNRIVSCGTRETRCRSELSETAAMSSPSSVTRPRPGSCSRNASLSRDDFPEPDGPTMAVRVPGAASKLTSSRSRRDPSYPNETPSKRSRDAVLAEARGGAPAGERTRGCLRSNARSCRRSAVACRISWYEKPSEASGCCSCSSSPLIATASPTVSAPLETQPAQATIMQPSPPQKLNACPTLRAATVLTSATASLSARARESSYRLTSKSSFALVRTASLQRRALKNLVKSALSVSLTAQSRATRRCTTRRDQPTKAETVASERARNAPPYLLPSSQRARAVSSSVGPMLKTTSRSRAFMPRMPRAKTRDSSPVDCPPAESAKCDT